MFRSLLVLSSLLLTTHAQLIPFLSPPSPSSIAHQQNTPPQQQPMAGANAPGIQLPPSTDEPAPPEGDVILSDIIGTQRSINIFASFTREIDAVASRLDASSKNTTVLAPLNAAITGLPRKPWEDPRDYGALGASAYEGKDGEDRAHRNMRRFTEAHVVPLSPWPEGEKVQSLVGLPLWWERREDGKAYVMPGSVEIEKVASRVANGEVWILKEVLNYAS